MPDNVVLLFNKTPEDWRRILGGFFRSGGIVGLVIVLLILILLGNPFFMVDPTEQAVVLRFGKHVRTRGAGLRLKFPWPVERVEIVDMQMRELGIGTGVSPYPPPWEEQRGQQRREGGDGVLMLTGDENIVRVKISVQYRVIDPVAFRFNVREPEKTLQDICDATLRRVIGDHGVDSALTEGKGKIQEDIRFFGQELADHYGLGLEIVTVNLNDVQPPIPVRPAYTAVISAKEEKERSINEAMGYRNGEIPKAEGNAAALVNSASGYARERVLHAQGEIRRFSDLLAEYRLAKDVTKKRLYLETLEEVLEPIDVTIVDKNIGNLLPLLNLGGVGSSLPSGQGSQP
jgi:membrane protease subunit HflK